MYKILVADDEDIIRGGIVREMRKIGEFQVFEAKNGETAVELILKERIDGVVLDIVMPKKNGIEVMERISSEGVMPVVYVLSGYDDFKYAQKMLKYGVSEYLLKPLSRADTAKLARDMLELLEERGETAAEYDELKLRSDLLSAIVENGQQSSEIQRVTGEIEGAAERVVIMARRNLSDGEAELDRGLKLIEGCPEGYRDFFRHHFVKCVIDLAKCYIHQNGDHNVYSGFEKSVDEHIKSDEELKSWIIDEIKLIIAGSELVSSKNSYYVCAKVYIDKHYSEDIGVASIAQVLYITPNYLGKIWKEQSGQSLIDYIKEVRLEKAAKLLTEGIYEVSEVAEKVGITDARYFSRLFKEKYKVSPSRYSPSEGKK